MGFNEEVAKIITDESIVDKSLAISKIYQSDTDRIRGEYSKKTKDLENMLREKELEGMTEIEKSKKLLDEQKQALETQRKEWEKDRIVKEKTDYFKEKGLSLDLFDLVGGKSVEEFEANSSKILEVINNQVASKLNSEAGRNEIGGNKEPKVEDIEAKAVEAFKNAF